MIVLKQYGIELRRITKDDIELIPRVGNQRIILGDADSLEKKMTNLLLFYKKAMPQVGWDTYRTINIKYTNQIVCEKRDSTEIARRPKTISSADSLRIQQKVSDSLINAVIGKTVSEQTAKATPKKVETVKKPEPKKAEAKKVEVKKPEAAKPKESKPAASAATKPKESKPADKKQTTSVVADKKKTKTTYIENKRKQPTFFIFYTF